MAALQRLVEGQVDENLGMPMIYTIVAAAQEWLRDKVAHLRATSRHRCCERSSTAAKCKRAKC